MIPGIVASGFRSSAVWTPAEIVTTAWFDAADSNTITLASGVSVWSDKSGNIRHASQGVTSYRPGISPWDDEKDAIDFGGNNRACLLFDHPAFTYSDRMVIHAVCEPSTYASRQTLLRRGYGQDTLDFGVTDRLIMRDDNTDDYLAEGDWQRGTKQFMSCGYTTGGEIFIKRNGVVEASNAVSFTPRQIDQEVFIGTGPSGDGSTTPTTLDWGFDGLIAELIVVTATENELENEKIEGYLAHKWGLAGELPSGHPYKNKAP